MLLLRVFAVRMMRGKRNPVRTRSLFRKLYAHECLHRAERRPLYVEYEKVDAGTPGRNLPIVCEPEDLVTLFAP